MASVPESSNSLIRPATLGDAFEIARVQVLAWKAAYSGIVPQSYLDGLSIEQRADWWRQYLGEPKGAVLVARVDERVVGWISFGPSRDDDGLGSAEIYAIYILPDHWRREIGSHLLKTADLKLAGFDSVLLWVLDGNDGALAFYRIHGFVPDAREKRVAIGGEELREIRLRRMRSGKTMARAEQP